MYCNYCKKNFERPLKGNSNTSYCPFCLGRLRPEKMELTPENMTAYVQSERLFSEGDIKSAVNLCNKAALSGNPYAAVNLGFYFEMKYLPSANNAARVENAFEWYDAVAQYNPEYRALRTNPRELDSASINFDTLLVEKAIRNVVSLIVNNYGFADSQNALSGEFNKKTLKDALNAAAKIVGVNVNELPLNVSAEHEAMLDEAQFFQMFAQSPVMGIKRINPQLLRTVTDGEFRDNTASLFKRYYFWIKLSPNGAYTKIENISQLTDEAQNAGGYGYVSAAFFDRKNKAITYRAAKRTVKAKLDYKKFEYFLSTGEEVRPYENAVFDKNDIIIAKADNDKILEFCTR